MFLEIARVLQHAPIGVGSDVLGREHGRGAERLVAEQRRKLVGVARRATRQRLKVARERASAIGAERLLGVQPVLILIDDWATGVLRASEIRSRETSRYQVFD